MTIAETFIQSLSRYMDDPAAFTRAKQRDYYRKNPSLYRRQRIKMAERLKVDPDLKRKRDDYNRNWKQEKMSDLAWLENHRANHRKYQGAYRALVKECEPERFSKWRRRQQESAKKLRANPEYYPKHNKYRRSLYRKSIQFKLGTNLRVRINHALRGTVKNGRLPELIGCNLKQLIDHLQNQFQPGMTWDNWGLGIGRWVVDHVRPCASFDLTKPEQQKDCFHFSNLQPMWYSENCSKKAEFKGKQWTYKDHQ